MPMHRYRRRFSGTTTAVGDTGPSMFGALWQILWTPITADTGLNVRLDCLVESAAVSPNTPSTNDTGMGFTVFTSLDVGVGGNQFAPRQRLHDPAGTEDTGLTPVVWNGERPRFKVIPSQSSFDGWLTAWWVD